MEPLNCFTLPDIGNNITSLDIEKGALRITANAKNWFPQADTLITINFNGISKEIKYKKGNSRSDILYVGKDFMDSMNVTPKSKLKITRQSPNEFSVEKCAFLFDYIETDNISYHQLKQLKEKYWKSLIENPFPKPPENGKALEMIRYFKRKVNGIVHSIGPYIDISVFEAANRIATDLVIINGIKQLIDQFIEPQNSIVSVRLGNRHESTKGDFTINGKEGEAFNVASSFYKVKLRSTNKKWNNGGLYYIFVNAEVFDEIKTEVIDSKIIKVMNWDEQ